MTPNTLQYCSWHHSKYGAAQLGHCSDWATDWTVRGSNPDSRKKFFCTPKPQTSSGAHPASYLMTTEILPRNKVAGTWCWPPTSKNEWGCTSISIICLQGVNRDNLYLYFSIYFVRLWKTTRNLSDDSRAQAENRAANLRLRTRLK